MGYWNVSLWKEKANYGKKKSKKGGYVGINFCQEAE